MMSMSLENEFITTKYKNITTILHYLFFSSPYLSKDEILSCQKTLSYISKFIEIQSIFICLLYSSFTSGAIIINWFRILFIYQILHYEGNFYYFEYTKTFFYKNGTNPLFFIVYMLVILLKIPLFVLPSYFIFSDNYIKTMCIISLFSFFIKYLIFILQMVANLLVFFSKIRIIFVI